jgi:hypothetical protein
MATKKVTKKNSVSKGTKRATPRATAMAKIKELREGFRTGTKKNPLPHFKYLNCAVSDVSSEKFPEMVQITLGPAKIMSVIGNKRYVNEHYAKLAIDEIHGYNIVYANPKQIERELEAAGIVPMDLI